MWSFNLFYSPPKELYKALKTVARYRLQAEARRGRVRLGAAWQGRQGEAWLGAVGLGVVR